MTFLSLELIVRWIHVLAAMTWVGGMIYTNFVLTPPATGKGIPPAFVRLMCMQRYKWFALGSLAVLVVTGIINVLARVPSLGNLLATPWGTVVLIKAILALAVIGITAFTGLVLGPSVVANAPKPGPKQPGPTPTLIMREKNLVLFSQVNLAVAVVILYLGILLV